MGFNRNDSLVVVNVERSNVERSNSESRDSGIGRRYSEGVISRSRDIGVEISRRATQAKRRRRLLPKYKNLVLIPYYERK